MKKMLTVLDERHVWHGPMIAAARARGYDAKRIFKGTEAQGRTGLGFIRPHAIPQRLQQNHEDYRAMRDAGLTMVQDGMQVFVYDDKSAQFRQWGKLMPYTRRFENRSEALEFVYQWDGWLVSKADVGASSNNVRILRTRAEQEHHVGQCFGTGIRVTHSAGGGGDKDVASKQHGYVLLQEYIPNDFTWRVNIVGRARAIFKRFNHPKKGTAQTGNVEPVMTLDDETESLLFFADRVFEHIGTKWCAIDVLRQGESWKLIETSLAWPWPSPGRCNEALFFGASYGCRARQWIEIWEVMLDEYEAGVWL